MNIKGSAWLGLGIFLTLALIGLFFVYASLAGPNYDSFYREKILSGEFRNPLTGLSINEYPEVDERLVHAFLVSLKVYNLHAPPLSVEIPAFEVVVDKTIYNAQVLDGTIIVKKGLLEKKDMVLRTTSEEIIKMLEDPATIQQSFRSGNSRIDYVADGSTLLLKGYYAMTSWLT